MMTGLKTILLSGFEPFGGEKINPSWEAVKEFQDEEIGNYIVKTVKLPVSFKKAKEIVWNMLIELKPSYYIAVGQAGGISKIHLERIALNLMDARIPDNDKFKPRDETIFDDAPLAYKTNLPLNMIRENLIRNGIPVEISNHAGTYVCNLVFFTALHAINKHSLNTKAGFIHVPYIFEQIMNKRGPGFPLEYIKNAIRIILETLTKI